MVAGVEFVGFKYGNVDAEGISPTEREYDKAAELSKPRLIFIKKRTEHPRDRREAALIAKAEKEVIRKSFAGINELRTAVYAALIRYLEQKEIIRVFPFDASKDTDATLADLDEDKIRDFIYMARRIHGRLDSQRLLSALNRYPSRLERKQEYFASPRNKAGLPGAIAVPV